MRSSLYHWAHVFQLILYCMLIKYCVATNSFKFFQHLNISRFIQSWCISWNWISSWYHPNVIIIYFMVIYVQYFIASMNFDIARVKTIIVKLFKREAPLYFLVQRQREMHSNWETLLYILVQAYNQSSVFQSFIY